MALQKTFFTGGAMAHSTNRRAISIVEVMVVLTIIGVLISVSAPSFTRSMEQSHADLAGANLRAIWNAQRIYWLENRSYANSLVDLAALDLIDSSTVSGTQRYTFSITVSNASDFTAVAARNNSQRWSGTFSIDATGTITGYISASGAGTISPGFL